jgi:predicted nuclease of predicted toxin-antitoxin system
MKLLFDQNLSFKLCQRLANIFPGPEQLRQIGLDTADDRSVWNYARSNGFVIATLDVDFAELAAALGTPPKVVWLRCGNQTTDFIERLLHTHAKSILAFGMDAQANQSLTNRPGGCW